MKYLLLFLPTILFCQIQINNNKDVKILFPFSEVKRSVGPRYLFKIKNETNDNYIIDTEGFYRRIEVYDENDNYVQPYLPYPPGGNNAERKDNECYKDYEIVLSNSTSVVLLNLFKYLGEHDLKNDKKYYIKINSIEFGKRFSSDTGCKNYIEEMEAKGYKVLEGSINAKIPLIP